MKIVCILSSSSLHGGSTRAFLSYSVELVKRHSDVNLYVVCPNSGSAYQYLKNNNVQVKVIPSKFYIYPKISNFMDVVSFIPKVLSKLILDRVYTKRLIEYCKTISPDIIYSNVGVINTGYNAARVLNIPHFYHLREYQNLDFGMKVMPSFSKFKSKLKGRGYSICITRGIQKHFNLSSENSIVIYDGVRLAQSACYSSDKEKYFLFVGRLEKAKGIELVIKSFADFCKTHKDYVLKIAGQTNSAEEESGIETLLENLSIKDRVMLLGNRSDVDDLMRHASALIMASGFEGFGLVTAEAMFNGCLVIGKNSSGTKEQFDNGLMITGNEIAIRFETEEELTEKMEEVVNNGVASYESLIKRAQTVVKQLYSIEKCADSIYQYFSGILNQSK